MDEYGSGPSGCPCGPRRDESHNASRYAADECQRSASFSHSRANTTGGSSLPSFNRTDPLYEMDSCLYQTLQEQDQRQEYVMSLKNKLNKSPTTRLTVIEQFHRLMKETLGERLFASLLKKGILNKNLPDEIVARKIMDALELRNKMLFATDATASAIDKMGFVQVAGTFRGALKAANSASAYVKGSGLEETAEERVLDYEGLFDKFDKPKPEVRVVGYIGLTSERR